MSTSSFGQRKISVEDDDIRGKVIYLHYSDGALSFFDSRQSADEMESLEKIHTLTLEDTYVNIYLKWLNPLK